MSEISLAVLIICAVAAVLGLLLLAEFRRRPPLVSGKTWARPQLKLPGSLPILAVLCIGIGLSAVAYFVTNKYYVHSHILRQYQQQATQQTLVTDQTIDRYMEAVEGISGLYAASQRVERDEFRAFVQHNLSRNPGIQALEWIPRVPAAERAAYEDQARRDGHADFRIGERNAEGEMVPALPREEYYPVFFVEPLDGNESALGFDLGSNPARLAALRKARDSGQAIATQRIKLVQESGQQYGVLVFVPVYGTARVPASIAERRAKLAGFALGVFRIGDLIEATIQEATAPNEFDIYLIDGKAAPGERLLHYRPSPLRSAPPAPLPEDELLEDLVYAAPLGVADRRWKIVFHHADGHAHGRLSVVPWGVAGFGLLLTLMLVQYLASSRGRARQVELLVEERSKELTKANAELKAEIALRGKMSDALHASRRRVAGILGSATAAIISVDGNLRIQIFNQGAETIFGYTVDEVIGQSLDMLIPIRFREGHGKYVESFGASSETSRRLNPQGQIFGLKKDGTEFPAEAAISKTQSGGQPIFTVMLHDITERKKMEEALRESEGRFRSVLDHSPSAICMKDMDGRFLLTNKRFQEWYCPPGTDPVGKTSHEFYPKEHADIFVEQDRKVLVSLQWTECEAEVSFADGTIHSILINKFPIFDAEDRPIGIGGINTDITEQRQVEQQLRQNAKMEALGTLAGGIAHDLNNVLVPVLGLTKLTMDQLPDDSRGRNNLEKVLEASNRAKELVSQILAFSRADQPERAPILLNTIVKEVLSFARATIPATIGIRHTIEPDVGTVLADPSQIHQVLMNLASNAMHAMGDKGGTLEITLGRVEIDAEFAVHGCALERGPHARLTVGDTGQGMDEQTLARIFEPFFTTKAVGEGTGMGLAVAHGIVTQHEGAITVSSQPGKGTLFEIYLPIIEVGEDAAAPGAPPARAAAAKAALEENRPTGDVLA